MSKPNRPPCRGCADRTPECHAHCERYAVFAADCQARNARAHLLNEAVYAVARARVDRYTARTRRLKGCATIPHDR